MPQGYQVHHRLSLDDGGNNAHSNLILVKNEPYHKAITNEQNSLTRGRQPGETRVLDLPIPEGIITHEGSMSDKIVELLREVQARQREYEWFVTAPASPQEIATLRERTRPELGIDLPEDYAAFLAASNGLDWNGTVFYATERRAAAPGRPFLDGVIDANLDVRDIDEFARLLVLGESGVDLYVYDPASPSFRIIDRVSLHTYEHCDSFEQLFAAAIGKRL